MVRFSTSVRGRWTSGSDAQQARRGIRRALAVEVAAGDLTERQAMAIATRIMRASQYACFDVAGTRANIRAVANQYATPTPRRCGG